MCVCVCGGERLQQPYCHPITPWRRYMCWPSQTTAPQAEHLCGKPQEASSLLETTWMSRIAPVPKSKLRS